MKITARCRNCDTELPLNKIGFEWAGLCWELGFRAAIGRLCKCEGMASKSIAIIIDLEEGRDA